MKRLICWAIVLVMLLTALPAMADNTRTSGLYTYKIKGNGTIEITKYNWANSSGNIYIPNMIDGYIVASIGDDAFNPQYNFLDAYLGKAVIYTQKQVGVTLPDGIKSIGNFAFRDANLSSINIPESVQFIGDGAFVDCPDIQFKIAPNHTRFAVIDGALYDKQQKELIATPINELLVIPEGIVSIRNYALYRSNIELGFLSNNVYTISISLPSTLKSIGDYAFSGRSLESSEALLPNSLVSIGASAFEDCELESFIIPASVTSIGQKAFANVDYESVYDTVTLPNDSQLTCIPDEAFINIHHTVVIKSTSIKEVGNYAFAGLSETLRNDYSVKIDISKKALESISSWGDYAFFCDTSRSNGTTLVNAPSSLIPSKRITVIPSGFNLLIDIPEQIEEIKSKAFTENVNVVDYYLPGTIKKIASDAFPQGSTFIVDAGSYAELWCSENGFGYSIKGQNNLDWLNN